MEILDEDGPLMCPVCRGSGEPVSGAPGNCHWCKGTGEVQYIEDPYDDPRIDWEREDRYDEDPDCDDNDCTFQL